MELYVHLAQPPITDLEHKRKTHNVERGSRSPGTVDISKNVVPADEVFQCIRAFPRLRA